MRISRLFFIYGMIFSVFILTSSNVIAQSNGVKPYWVSIDKSEARMRTGPGTDYPIKWVYKRKNLPVKVIAKLEDWRQVEDPDGDQGWMHVRLLSPARTAMVIGSSNASLLDRPEVSGRIAWRAEPGVVGRINDCQNGYCYMDIAGRAGYIDVRKIIGEEKL